MALLHSRSSFYSPPEVFKTATNTQGISASVSLPVALEKIFAYLEKQNHRPSSESLALKLEPCTFTSIEFTHLLESLNPDEFEFRYQPEIHIFELLPMPKFVHDAFSFFLGRLCHHRIPWLTPHEHDHLNVFKSSQTMKGSAPTTFVHSKRQAMDKEPDGAITFGDLEGPDDVLWPVVVAEVGFSQQYNSLLQDARQWLLRAEMPPTIVMLLKIQENLPGLRMRKLTPDYSVRLQNLLRKYGDGFRLAKANMDGDGVSGVDFNYRHMQQEILVEDWVGEMEVFFEIWVREETNSEIRPRVQRYSVIPAVEGQDKPVLLVTDLIPCIHHSRFANFDPSRQIEIDFVPFVTIFEKACRSLAASRACEFLRPGRPYDFSDPEYQFPVTEIQN